MRALLLMVAWAIALSIGMTGCHDGSDEGGPRITDFSFLAQFDPDPFTAVFLFSYTSNGPMDGGTAAFFVGNDSEPRITYEMSKLLQASDIPKNATRGEVAATLRFGGEARTGDVDIYLQLSDPEGKKSNKARVTLRLTY